tara:strand:+ start:3754 stop:6882 length:3129 start_codon:yes stop_codon:yes gene_type:complete
VRNIQKTLSGEDRLTVILFHTNDQPVIESLDEIQLRSANGEVSDFLFVAISESSISTFVLREGRKTSVDLSSEISKLTGYFDVERIDMISVCSVGLESSSMMDLAVKVKREVSNQKQLSASGEIKVLDHRIYFPEYANLGDSTAISLPDGFLGGGASSRLIVLPTDKAKDKASETQVELGSPLFVAHVTAETLSICGLWISQTGSALEKLNQGHTGDDSVVVQVVRSFVRTATTSLDEIGENAVSFFEGNLPVPPGKMPAPNPYFLVDHAASLIHHKNFQLRPMSKYEFGKGVHGTSLLKKIIVRIWRDFLSIPQILKHGFKSELRKDVDRVAQDLVGENSWLQVISRETSEINNDKDEQIDSAINEINSSLEEPKNAVTFGDEWTQVLELCLGVVDGSDAAQDLRQSAGDNRWVAIDAKSIGPKVSSGSYAAVANAMGVPNPQDESQEETIYRKAQGEDVSSSDSKARGKDLLSLITEKFNSEVSNADTRLRELISRISNLRRPEEKGTDLESKFIKMLFSSSIFLFLLSLLIFSPLHTIFEQSWDAITRARLFIIATAPILLLIFAFYAPNDPNKRKVFNILSFVSVTALATTGYIYADYVSGKWTQWIGLILMIVMLALIVIRFSGILCRVSTSFGESGGLALKISYIAFPIYLLAVLTVGANNDFYHFHSRTGFILTFVIAITLFVSSGAYVSIERQREESSFDDWKSEFTWLTAEAKRAARDLRLLRNYQVQWVGTGLVLARLFQYPHGLSADDDFSLSDSDTEDSVAQKFQVISLIPTSSGMNVFREMASNKLSEPGWLASQYRSMVRDYQNRRSLIQDDITASSSIMPETDPYPVALEEAIRGEGSGQRWEFCYEVYDGKFDRNLRRIAIQKLTEALLETYLEHTNSYETSKSSNNSDDLTKAFNELLADKQQTWSTAALGDYAHGTLQGESKVSTNIWWPRDLLQSTTPSDEQWKQIFAAETLTSSTSIFSQIVRVDISEVVILSNLIRPINETKTNHSWGTGKDYVLTEKGPEKLAPPSGLGKFSDIDDDDVG